jgi:anti-sigma B factor antagonist
MAVDTNITTTEYKRCTVVSMDGRIDTNTAPGLQSVMEEVSTPNIVFDMAGINFISSKGLWVLSETQKACKKNDGMLVLVVSDEEGHPNRKILDSFKLVGMDQYFTTFTNLTDAVGNF